MFKYVRHFVKHHAAGGADFNLISIKKTLQAPQITRHCCFSVYMCEWARIMRLLIEFLISIFQVSEEVIVRRKFQLKLHQRSDFFP